MNTDSHRMRLSKLPVLWLFVTTIMLTTNGVMSQDEATVIINLKQGEIFAQREVNDDNKFFYGFRGIPYAQPPLDGLRFRDPIPPSAWYDTLDGSVSPPVCPQVDVEEIQRGNIVVRGDEDCLYLNVYTTRPSSDSNLPVIVWIHGGAFIAGGAEEYAPMALLSKDIVLVSIQYRLGTLGFLSTQDDVLPGNLALKDQTMALKWVKDNIKDLGGDPDRITLMGQSSGAASAHFQILTPSAQGLFNRAILQSGSSLSPWAVRNDHWKVAHMIGQIHNCSGIKMNPPALDSTSLLYCLQGLTVEELVVAPSYFSVFQNSPIVMVPRVDGVYIPDHPAALLKSGRYNKVDLISGFNRDEGALEALPLLLNANLSNEIAENFGTVAPTILKIGDEDRAPAIAETVFRAYLRDIPKDEHPPERLVQMLSDGGFKVPQDEMALLHGTQQNVYAYELQYRGQYSTTDLYNKTLGKEWVSHADDLQYLYGENPYFPPLERDDDFKLRDIMVTLWTNFAATGVPTPDATLGFLWVPVTRLCLQYLALSINPFIRGYDRGVVAEFWRNLPLARNIILYPERFALRGPFFFQPPVVPGAACVGIPGPIGPAFGGGIGGSFGGGDNGGGFIGGFAGGNGGGNGFAGGFGGGGLVPGGSVFGGTGFGGNNGFGIGFGGNNGFGIGFAGNNLGGNGFGVNNGGGIGFGGNNGGGSGFGVNNGGGIGFGGNNGGGSGFAGNNFGGGSGFGGNNGRGSGFGGNYGGESEFGGNNGVGGFFNLPPVRFNRRGLLQMQKKLEDLFEL